MLSNNLYRDNPKVVSFIYIEENSLKEFSDKKPLMGFYYYSGHQARLYIYI